MLNVIYCICVQFNKTLDDFYNYDSFNQAVLVC